MNAEEIAKYHEAVLLPIILTRMGISYEEVINTLLSCINTLQEEVEASEKDLSAAEDTQCEIDSLNEELESVRELNGELEEELNLIKQEITNE
tara:strand:+ start:764 stop:1042 length:279 start_codon:yes stop_codon:yes gene_type:complete